MGFWSFFILFLFGSVIVLRSRFFRVEGTSPILFLFLFWIKVVAGCILYLVYSRHYTERSVSDIFRYFDDAQILYSSLKHSPADFFSMLTGIGADAPHLQVYYGQMQNWNLGKLYNFYNDNRSIIRFNALIMLFSQGYFHIHTLVMCFLSLIGLTALYRFFLSFIGPSGWTFIGVFLLPSVLFWSSGVLKEGLLFFGLGIFLWSCSLLLFEGVRWRNILLCLLGLIILTSVKIYILFCLLPGVVALWWCGKEGKGVLWKYLVSYIVFFSLGYLSFQQVTSRDPLAIVAEKQYDFWLLARGGTYVVDVETSDTIYIPLIGQENALLIKNADGTASPPTPVNAFRWVHKKEGEGVQCLPERRYHELLRLTYTGSRIESTPLEASWGGVISKTPSAFFNVLLRPLPWEATGVLSIFSSFENLMILFFLILSFIYRARKPDQASGPVNSVFFFCLLFFLTLALVVGLTTPVAGAIVRYKTPVLPFLFTAGALWLHFGKSILRNKM